MPRSNSMNGGIIGKDNTPSPSKKLPHLHQMDVLLERLQQQQ